VLMLKFCCYDDFGFWNLGFLVGPPISKVMPYVSNAIPITLTIYFQKKIVFE